MWWKNSGHYPWNFLAQNLKLNWKKKNFSNKIYFCTSLASQDSVVGMVTRHCQESCLFSKVPRLSLRPTQRSTKWASGVSSPSSSWPGRESGHLLHPVTKLRDSNTTVSLPYMVPWGEQGQLSEWRIIIIIKNRVRCNVYQSDPAENSTCFL